MNAINIKENDSTITATDAVMKFWFNAPRLILWSPINSRFSTSSSARGGEATKWQVSWVGYGVR